MKIRGLLALSLLIASLSVNAQLKKKIYHIKAVTKEGHQIKGWITTLEDSAVQIRLSGKHPVDTLIPIKHIQQVYVRRKNAPERGFGTGALAGAGVGALLGLGTYSPPICDGFCIDFGPGFSAIGGGLLGGIVGGIVGLAGRSAYRKYMIFGDQPSYESFKNALLTGPKSTLEKP